MVRLNKVILLVLCLAACLPAVQTRLTPKILRRQAVTPGKYLHIVQLKGEKVPYKGQYGFIPVNSDKDDFFYMLYPPRNNNATAPLIIWLSGGPGCASTMAMIYENGPIKIDASG